MCRHRRNSRARSVFRFRIRTRCCRWCCSTSPGFFTRSGGAGSSCCSRRQRCFSPDVFSLVFIFTSNKKSRTEVGAAALSRASARLIRSVSSSANCMIRAKPVEVRNTPPGSPFRSAACSPAWRSSAQSASARQPCCMRPYAQQILSYRAERSVYEDWRDRARGEGRLLPPGP